MPLTGRGCLVVAGADRLEDQYVEAHIYGNFNAESVQSVQFVRAGASRTDKSDIRVIEELLAKRGSVGAKK